LLRAMIDLAHAGNITALRFCCERIVGKPRAAAIELDLAAGAENDPAAILTAAIRGMADGEIAPSEAAAIARVATVAHAVRTGAARPPRRAAELRRRCAAAEAAARRAEAAAQPEREEAPEAAPEPEPTDEPAASPVIPLYPARAAAAAAAAI